LLLVGTYRFGFGCYERYVDDGDSGLTELCFCSEVRKLDDRALRLAELLKRSSSASSLSSSGSRRTARDDEVDDDWQLPPQKQTASSQKQTARTHRCDYSQQLREILDCWPAVHEAVGRWRKTTSAWNITLEKRFFEGLRDRGLSAAGDVLDTCGFPPVPDFLRKRPLIIKRIKQLHSALGQTGEARAPAPPSPSPPGPVAPPRRTAGPTYDDLIAGNYELPLPVTTNGHLISLGTIVTDRPSFHSERYIYPAGFKTSRLYTSPLNANEKMLWFSEILDEGGDSPVFLVSASEDETATFRGPSPTACWAGAMRLLGERFNISARGVSGPEAFLLSQPIVTVLIEALSGATECRQYVMKNLTESTFRGMKRGSGGGSGGGGGGEGGGGRVLPVRAAPARRNQQSPSDDESDAEMSDTDDDDS
jgi:chromodomain-helicase-DNA-binding protein 7